MNESVEKEQINFFGFLNYLNFINGCGESRKTGRTHNADYILDALREPGSFNFGKTGVVGLIRSLRGTL